jgi:YidC/Oxa1 family membrane protein insertase
MDRRTLYALILSFALIMIYMRLVMPVRQKQQPGAQETPLPAERQKAEDHERNRQATKGIIEVRKCAPEGKLSTIKNGAMEVVFSTEGGCIANVKLNKSEIIKKGPIELVNALSPPLQLVELSIEGECPPKTAGTEYKLDREDREKGDISYRGLFGALRITKTYSVPRQGFVIQADIELENLGETDLDLSNGMEVSAGSILALTQGEKEAYVGIEVDSDSGKISRIGISKLKDGKKDLKPLRWLAIRNQFFSIVMKPAQHALGYTAEAIGTDDGLSGVKAAIMVKGFTLKQGKKKNIPLSIYLGPKEYSALASFGAAEVIDFGWFGFLGKWILKGLNALYAICGNYGVAIILLTIIIRIILYPLNQKSFRSMKQMQQLQPELASLQEKYKSDPKKKQQEMMRIYKEHGINPMGGCLPLLIQMPILVAFFRVLQNAIELWGAPFFLWMNDLSGPDALMRFSTGKTAVPIVGVIIDGQGYVLLNILPILMLAVFYIQQKMSTPGVAMSAEQEQQQKMMGFMMPVMFGVIFYNMPAGLNLYFAASTILGILQQKYMIR